jgi:eukaryotic-like serine/threonine-protein kinase
VAAFDPKSGSRDVAAAAPRVIGRYAVLGEIGSGGMATVYFGRLLGAAGFTRPVAIKRLHPQYAKTPKFVDAFLDEARFAARIRHPNVVPTLDVVAEGGELLLVMEYISGAALSDLIELAGPGGGSVPPPIASAIVSGVLHGLHAAHEAKDDDGAALKIVHRDVSPHNIIVGHDGIARVLDFGVAKAQQRIAVTGPGELKGKLAYMAPEQIMLEEASPRTDIYAAGVVLWEALTGEPLFRADNTGALISKILNEPVRPPSAVRADVPAELDRAVLKALERNADQRFANAREFALALEEAGVAPVRDVGEWVRGLLRASLSQRVAMGPAPERKSSGEYRAVGAIDSVETLPVMNAEELARQDFVLRHGLSSVPTDGGARRRGVGARALVALGLLTGAALLTALVVKLVSPGPPGARASESAPKSGEAEVAPPASTRPTEAPAESAVTAAASPGSSSLHEALPRASAGPAVHASVRPVRNPAPGCDPPFTIDSDGIKHLKHGCLDN